MKKIFKFFLACCLLFMSMPEQVHAEDKKKEPCSELLSFFIFVNEDEPYEHYETSMGAIAVSCQLVPKFILEITQDQRDIAVIDSEHDMTFQGLCDAKIKRISFTGSSMKENFEYLQVSAGTKSELEVRDTFEGFSIENINSDTVTLSSTKPIEIEMALVEYTGHSLIDATCIKPQICRNCGEEYGEPLGHSFLDATCLEPKTCSRCNETEGEPLGHDFLDATCLEPKTCSRCNETEGNPLGHNFDYISISNWSHLYACKRCGETNELSKIEPHRYFRHKCDSCNAIEHRVITEVEEIEEIPYTNKEYIINYKNTTDHFNVSVYCANANGLRIRENEDPVVIEANDLNALIDHVEIKVGNYAYRYPQVNVSSGTKSALVDDTFVITDVNAPSLTLSLSGLGYIQIKDITVYYHNVSEDEINHIFEYVINDNETHSPKCSVCELVTEPETHSLEVSQLDGYFHQFHCTECDYSINEYHSFENHQCTICNAKEYKKTNGTEAFVYPDIDTEEYYVVEGENFTLNGYDARKNGMSIAKDEPGLLIEANDDSLLIESIEVQLSIYPGRYPYLSVSSGTKGELVDDVFEITDINEPSIKLGLTGRGYMRVKDITVHYKKVNEEEINHVFDQYITNEDGTQTLVCSICGEAMPLVGGEIEQQPEINEEENKKPNETPNDTPASSNTGDNNQMYLYAMLLLASGTTTLILRRKKEME